MMRGRPILGTISGFFFGLFGGITLFLFGVIPLHSPLLWILPIVGIALGLGMAAWAPFGSDHRKGAAQTPASPIAGDQVGDQGSARSGGTVEFDAVETPDVGIADDDA